jgi:uncharacterized protein (DUF736 family)
MVETDKTVYIGAAWKHTDKAGNTFLSCKLNDDVKKTPGKFFLFKNNRQREGKKDPDYNIVLAKPKSIKGQQEL